jgi:nitroimidazol reductase NimA-like FMN-containing flavoprotein (pyridoxamine 5'-phosphate oxidase superfamily)
MRKKEKEIKDKNTMERIIQRATVCRIGLSENDKPYVVPLIFGYTDDCLYFRNNTVCFEIDVDNELVQAENACGWSMKYYSVIGFGKAFLVEDFGEKQQALDTIMEHYSGKSSFEYPENALNNTAIIKVKIESMTGKKSGY